MPTKYKYGKDGSYFDPETKRTYYKDPQYQKAYDDEWNRLEKLYKMKQEEQRRIERENFQRVLAQADALTKSMQALGYRTPLPWEQKNRFDGSEGSKIERNTQGGEALTQRRYYQDGDYTGYTRDNGNPVAFDEEGNLIDQVTGEKGTMLTGTPDVEAIGEKKRIGIPMTSPSAPIPLSGILSPSTEDYLKAADNTASAFSAAKWMDTAYDAMYTPDEINYPWMEGNKGLGSPVLDFGFDFATGLGLAKLANLSKGIDALYNGVNNAKRVDKGVDFAKSNIDVNNFKNSSNISMSRELYNLPEYAHPNFPIENALDYHLKRLADSKYRDELSTIRQLNTDNYTTNQLINDAIIRHLRLNAPEDAVQKAIKNKEFIKSIKQRKDWVDFANQLSSPYTPGLAIKNIKTIYTSPKKAEAMHFPIKPVISHELDHAIHVPDVFDPSDFLEDLSNVSPKLASYFTKNNGTEFAARGSQIKDYFGLTNSKQEITPDMLKYARDNYIRDVL